MGNTRFSAVRWGLWGLVGLVGLGSSAEATTLRWKFKAGETLRWEMEQKQDTTIKAGGREISSKMVQTVDLRWTVKNVKDDGTAEMGQTIDRMRTKMESAIEKFEYDSKSDKEPEGLVAQQILPLFKAMIGAEFTFTMNAQGELSDVKVPEQIVKILRDSGPAAPGGSGMFSEEGLKNMIRESSLALPSKDLAKGESWTRTTKMPPSPIGTMTLDKTYRFQGPDAQAGPDVDAIELESKLDFKPAPNAPGVFEIKSHQGKGTFFFDEKAGRVVRSNVSEGVETVEGAMNFLVNKKQEMTATMKLVEVVQK